MVPLNPTLLMIDLIAHLNAEVIVVTKNYLGSINHTLLTLEMLRLRQIPVRGIVINGDADPDSENAILNYSGVTYLGRIAERSEEHTSELLSLMRISYAVFCLNK